MIDLFAFFLDQVFHTHFQPLEWTIPHHEDNACYVKLVCLKEPNMKVIGLHILSPHAGEVTQGYAVAMR